MLNSGMCVVVLAQRLWKTQLFKSFISSTGVGTKNESLWFKEMLAYSINVLLKLPAFYNIINQIKLSYMLDDGPQMTNLLSKKLGYV